MRLADLLCALGLHAPPDPATPREHQHDQSLSLDCGYPPYRWRCSRCHRWYGWHWDLPRFDAAARGISGR